jgi:hypothetical protein
MREQLDGRGLRHLPGQLDGRELRRLLGRVDGGGV